MVWTAQPETGAGHYVAVFNTSDSAQKIEKSWKELGLNGSDYQVRDLWDKKDLGSAKSLTVTVEPHGAALLRVKGK